MNNNTAQLNKEMEYELAHQKRIIERMKEREAWFFERIAQLEKFGSFVSSEMVELKKNSPLVSEPLCEGGRPPPLILGDTSLADHHRIGTNMRKSVLDDDGMVGGMTPRLPLPSIPTHSLKKQVSWHKIENFAFACGGCSPKEMEDCSANGNGGCSANETCPLIPEKQDNLEIEYDDTHEPWCSSCHKDSGCDGDHGDEQRDGFFLTKGRDYFLFPEQSVPLVPQLVFPNKNEEVSDSSQEHRRGDGNSIHSLQDLL